MTYYRAILVVIGSLALFACSTTQTSTPPERPELDVYAECFNTTNRIGDFVAEFGNLDAKAQVYVLSKIAKPERAAEVFNNLPAYQQRAIKDEASRKN